MSCKSFIQIHHQIQFGAEGMYVFSGSKKHRMTPSTYCFPLEQWEKISGNGFMERIDSLPLDIKKEVSLQNEVIRLFFSCPLYILLYFSILIKIYSRWAES